MPVQHLLVVEDDPIWRERLGETARSEGCEVVTVASDGAQALSYLSEARYSRPNLVVLDLMLPHVDGWELYGRMRTTDDLRHIPVLMMSVAHQRVELSGVVGFLHKTDSPEPALTELRECLRRFAAPTPRLERLGPYALQLTEDIALTLGTLAPRLHHAVRQHLLRATELAGSELPMTSTWLMALPGDPPSLLVTVDGIRVVLEVDDVARKLVATTVIIPPHLPRS
jgi:CheY-like chemotaxis protein